MDKPLYRGTFHCFQSIVRQESVSLQISCLWGKIVSIEKFSVCEESGVFLTGFLGKVYLLARLTEDLIPGGAK